MILFAEDSIRIGEKLFLFAKDFNMLFSIDIVNGNITFLGGIPEEQTTVKRRTCKLICWEENIIIVPLLARKIWIYSLSNGSWKGITIKDYKHKEIKTKFRQALIEQGYLYLIGGHYPAILKMNLDTYEMFYIEEPFLCYKEQISGELYFRGDFVYRDGILYLASCRDNSILSIHLNTQAYEKIEIGREENRYSGIVWDDSHYWISPRINTAVVKWNGKEQVEEYEIPLEKRTNKISYAGIFSKNNQKIIPALIGSSADTIIIANDGQMSFDNQRYTFYKKTEKGEYLSQDSHGNLIFINDKGEKRQFSCVVSGETFNNFLDILHVDIDDIIKKINVEKAPFSIFELLELTGKRKIFSIKYEQNTGIKIWGSRKL